MPGGLPEPRPGSLALAPWTSCMLLRPSVFELVRSALLIRVKRDSLAPWVFAFLNSRTAASKRGTMYRVPTRNTQPELAVPRKQTCIPGAVESTGLKTRHYRDLARLKSCPSISMEFRCGGGL